MASIKEVEDRIATLALQISSCGDTTVKKASRQRLNRLYGQLAKLKARKLTFLPATITTPRETTIANAMATGVTREAIEKVLDEMAGDEIFLSACGTYQVTRRYNTPNGFGISMVCLSCKRVDREPLQDWRVLQEIKNALVGEECEAIELFPAESRLVDTANQRWLWCFVDPTVRVPLGFAERAVCKETSMVGTKQRPRED